MRIWSVRGVFVTVAVSVLAVLVLYRTAAAQSYLTEQELRQLLEDAADRSNLSQAFQALSILNVTPGISSAAFYVGDDTGKDDEIDSYKYSPSRTFEPVYGVKPYVEGTVGYLLGKNFDVSAELSDKGQTTSSIDIRTLSFLGGVGAEFDLFDGTVIRPILLAGYSRIWDSSRTRGPDSQTLDNAGKGIIFDAWLNTALVGGAVELEHVGYFDPQTDIDYVANVRYNQLYANTFSASNSVLEGSSTFGVLTARAEFSGPVWGVSLLDRELRWIGFASNTYLPGDDETDALGFGYFFEVGGGLKLVDREVIKGLEGVAFRTSALFGGNVYGWTAGLSLEF